MLQADAPETARSVAFPESDAHPSGPGLNWNCFRLFCSRFVLDHSA